MPLFALLFHYNKSGLNRYIAILYLFAFFLVTSCSMTKGLKEGELLLYKTNYEFTNPKLINKQGKVESELALIARPTPALKRERWQVAIYNNTNKKRKEKSLGRWIQRKIGKPPALYEDDIVERSRLVMEKHLQDNGYFGATITSDTLTKGKKVTLNYTVTSKGQYFVRDIYRPLDSLPLTHLLQENEAETLLKQNKPYDLGLLSAERSRLADIANNHGFFDITKDNFFYYVDTTAGDLQVDLYLRLKQTGDISMYQVYFLNDSWVFPDYSLEQKGAINEPMDTISYHLLNIVQKEKILRPTVLNRLIWQDSVATFSKKEQQQTVNRLLNLGIYKFVNIRFEKKVENDSLHLDRFVYLTPGLMRDVSTEFQLNSRSGNFLGSEISGTFSHKNLFKGAELFNVSLSTGIETNIGANANSVLNTVNIGLNASIQLPGFYAPFVKRKRVRGETLPRTAFSMGDDFQSRTGFFTLNSFNLSYGYNVQKKRWSHQFSPLFINVVNLLATSSKLDDLLAQNRRLRASFENVLILGANYKFSYSKQQPSIKNRSFYYLGGVEIAGNGLYLATGATGQKSSREVLNIPFSQYLKVDNDLRQYFPFLKGTLAGRISTGIAFPYGNAEVMPYIKQYFIGGASSVRAFRIRTLGPGSFETKLDDGSNFVDQTGDLKLEMSAEYRFPIFSYLKGGLFVDAGNIWLIRGDADESTPAKEGLFRFDRFYKEIAVGTGFGLRIDFDVAVIRLDWAFPIRRPSQISGSKWLFSELDFLDKSWRRENVVWNIAIGYPF